MKTTTSRAYFLCGPALALRFTKKNKKNIKKFGKPLDKSKKVWYNKDTEKERKGKQNENQNGMLRHGWNDR